MDENAERDAAISRLKNKQAFRQHLVAYIVINVFLVLVWALTGAGYFWPIWVIGGWGIAIAFHAWSIFGGRPITEDAIRREMGRGQSGSL